MQVQLAWVGGPCVKTCGGERGEKGGGMGATLTSCECTSMPVQSREGDNEQRVQSIGTEEHMHTAEWARRRRCKCSQRGWASHV